MTTQFEIPQLILQIGYPAHASKDYVYIALPGAMMPLYKAAILFLHQRWMSKKNRMAAASGCCRIILQLLPADHPLVLGDRLVSFIPVTAHQSPSRRRCDYNGNRIFASSDCDERYFLGKLPMRLRQSQCKRRAR